MPDLHSHLFNVGGVGSSGDTVPGREYSAEERTAIKERLERYLGPEYISWRPGPGGSKMFHLTVQKAVQLANEMFGFDGWSSSIVNTTVDYALHDPESKRFNCGVSVIVRVTLRNGTYHEDIGYGSAENSKNMAMGFEQAKKSGASDALKRALKNFGNVLGNCLYDKQYMSYITKIKVQPAKFDLDKVHRHADYAPIKPAPAPAAAPHVTAPPPPRTNGTAQPPDPLAVEDAFDDEFGDFDVEDFSIGDDLNYLDDDVPTSPTKQDVLLSKPINGLKATEQSASGRLTRNQVPDLSSRAVPPAQTTQQKTAAARPSTPQPHNETFTNRNSQQGPGRSVDQSTRNNTASGAPVGQAGGAEQASEGGSTEHVGFFSAKAAMGSGDDAESATKLRADAAMAFNPSAESPSIRKTPGIDHTKSKPLTKQLRHVPGVQRAADAAVPRGNIVNPQLDTSRRIGAPHSPSPLANRGSYKPPTMTAKRPVDGGAPVAGDGARAPLGDLPANEKMVGDGGDLKRQKRVAD